MTDQSALSRQQRLGILTAAFTAWMFAGMIISLFVLIHRQMTLELLGSSTPEQVVARWFAWYQAAFLFGAATGGLLFGWLGDKIGRTRSLGGSVLCFSLFT
ncbi:MAG: MFS transporter, partial [Planctomycetes bacterium]|nr:MFS transporter [Planctomycetota bacterium]